VVSVEYVIAWILLSRMATPGGTSDIVAVSVITPFALFYILPISVWGVSKLSDVITANKVLRMLPDDMLEIPRSHCIEQAWG
jgi:hypothetical protein